MTSVLTNRNGNGATRSRITTRRMPTDPRKRQASRRVAGLVLAACGAWLAATGVASAGHKTKVLAVAHPVPRYHVVQADDLRVVEVDAPEVPLVPASNLKNVIGRLAASDLIEGSLLAPSQLRPVGDIPVAAGYVTVGLLLPRGSLPVDGVAAGDQIQVVIRAGQGSTGAPMTVNGRVQAVGATATNGDRSVSVVIAADDGPAVAAAASDRRASLILLGGS